MKRITLLLLMVGMTTMAQVKGNKNIQTKRFDISGITALEMELYAKVTIDANTGEYISITADENIIPLISAETIKGVLKLEQNEWIQPSQPVIINIGASNLKKLSVGVHETVYLKNFNGPSLVLNAPIGKVVAEGSCNTLSIRAKNGTVDSSKLLSENANVTISGSGKVIVNTADTLLADLSEDARLEKVIEPKSALGDAAGPDIFEDDDKYTNTRYIDLEIKNNSWNRIHFVVVGPKNDGTSFSYGFPMMPGSVRTERWTVGTKVYRKNSLGFKKLLVTISEKDEGKTVKLFD